MSSSTTPLERAIEIVQHAIEEDTKKNYSEAKKQYQDAIDFFMIALKHEKNPQSKQLIRTKVEEYLVRAETLNKHLAPQVPSPTMTMTVDKATEIVRRAIEEDVKQNYAEASKQYQNALDHLMLALKYENNENSLLVIRTKINEYLARAEVLNEHLTSENSKLSPPTTVVSPTTLDIAINIVQRAIEEDITQNYAEASRQYQKAIDHFMLALKYEKNEEVQVLIRAKINEYQERAEQLNNHLSAENREEGT